MYFLDDKQTLYKRRSIEPRTDYARLVLPELCRGPVMKMGHSLGHFGGRKTYLRLKLLFDWPEMKSGVERFCAACVDCQL